jgi:hypothetical protein
VSDLPPDPLSDLAVDPAVDPAVDLAVDLAVVETTVQAAVRRRSFDGLNLLGHGEISMVLGWPSEAPSMALKRVPPFRDRASAEQYLAECNRWFGLMRERQVAVLPTESLLHERADGMTVAYHRQPLVDPARIGHRVLREAPAAERHPMLDAIVDTIGRAVSHRVGIDGQAANWYWHDGTATMLDVTSPFLLNEAGDDLEYDSSVFLAEYPAVVRGYLRKELLGIVQRYSTATGVISDMVANMMKEGLDRWVQPTIDTTHDRLGVTIDRAECQAMFDTDRKLFPLALRLKRVQRRWMLMTGRRYESLLPEHTTYRRPT